MTTFPYLNGKIESANEYLKLNHACKLSKDRGGLDRLLAPVRRGCSRLFTEVEVVYGGYLPSCEFSIY